MKGDLARMRGGQLGAHANGYEVIARAVVEGEAGVGMPADGGEGLAVVEAVEVEVAEGPAEHLTPHVRHAGEG